MRVAFPNLSHDVGLCSLFFELDPSELRLLFLDSSSISESQLIELPVQQQRQVIAVLQVARRRSRGATEVSRAVVQRDFGNKQTITFCRETILCRADKRVVLQGFRTTCQCLGDEIIHIFFGREYIDDGYGAFERLGPYTGIQVEKSGQGHACCRFCLCGSQAPLFPQKRLNGRHLRVCRQTLARFRKVCGDGSKINRTLVGSGRNFHLRTGLEQPEIRCGHLQQDMVTSRIRGGFGSGLMLTRDQRLENSLGDIDFDRETSRSGIPSTYSAGSQTSKLGNPFDIDDLTARFLQIAGVAVVACADTQGRYSQGSRLADSGRGFCDSLPENGNIEILFIGQAQSGRHIDVEDLLSIGLSTNVWRKTDAEQQCGNVHAEPSKKMLLIHIGLSGC